MNKTGFIKELSEQTGYNEERCILINDIIENHFILGRKNKDKIVEDLQTKINLSEDDAQSIYNISMRIIAGEIKDKLKQPFESQD